MEPPSQPSPRIESLEQLKAEAAEIQDVGQTFGVKLQIYWVFEVSPLRIVKIGLNFRTPG